MTPKNPAAVALGRKGGKATAENRTAEQRSEAARKAVEARWSKTRELVEEITEGTKALLAKTRKRRATNSFQRDSVPHEHHHRIRVISSQRGCRGRNAVRILADMVADLARVSWCVPGAAAAAGLGRRARPVPVRGLVGRHGRMRWRGLEWRRGPRVSRV